MYILLLFVFIPLSNLNPYPLLIPLMFSLHPFSAQDNPLNASPSPRLTGNNLVKFQLSEGRGNPFASCIPHLGEAGQTVSHPLHSRISQPQSLYTPQILNALAHDPSQNFLARANYALHLPESDDRDALLKALILEHKTGNASHLGNYFLGISNLRTREEALEAYVQDPEANLHVLISQCKADIQGRLLGVLCQHSKILLRLISQEAVPFFWRLYYTCMLSPDVGPAERHMAEDHVWHAFQNGSSALARLEDIRVALKHYPYSVSRNPILERFMDEVMYFTPAQRIELLSLMGESPAKDQKALQLSQDAATFTLEQRRACLDCMSLSSQKEAALRALE